MSWTQVAYRYDGSYAGFLTCVYEAYVNRESPIDFRPDACPLCSLYPERTVVTRQVRGDEHAAPEQQQY